MAWLPVTRQPPQRVERIMAVEIIMFEFLIALGIALFIIGGTRESIGAGFAFLCLAAVIFIVSGALVWSDGLTTGMPTAFSTVGDVTTVTYSVQTATEGTPLWIISQALVYGGIALALISLTFTVKTRRQTRAEAAEAI